GVEHDGRAAELVDAGLERHARAGRALLEHHRQHAVGERLVDDVILEALLDDARAAEEVLDLVAAEVGQLQEMLHAAAAAGDSARNAFTRGARISTMRFASASWITSGGSRRITRSAVTLATSPAASARFTMSPHGRSSSTPIMSPMPRTSFTPATASSSRRRPSWMISPMRWAWASSPSFSITSSVTSAATIASGLPPNVEPWLPGLNTFAAAPRAAQAPI